MASGNKKQNKTKPQTSRVKGSGRRSGDEGVSVTLKGCQGGFGEKGRVEQALKEVRAVNPCALLTSLGWLRPSPVPPLAQHSRRAVAEEPPGGLAGPGFSSLEISALLRVRLNRGGPAGPGRRRHSESLHV